MKCAIYSIAYRMIKSSCYASMVFGLVVAVYYFYAAYAVASSSPIMTAFAKLK